MENIIKESTHSAGRIKILDGFRAIAILGVVLYHYFYRWNDPVTPYYGSDFFHQGFRGVEFFFMISGFVICYSLENTSSLNVFWKKRFIRLFPSMFIASILTFGFLRLFDYNLIFPKSHNFRNLITSITFLPPSIFDFIFGTKNHFSYLNLSYWTLWPEIQFYFLSSAIYFFNKLKFRKFFIAICLILILLYQFIQFNNLGHIVYVEKILNLFNLLKYLSYFVSGALFYLLYKSQNFSYHILLLVVFVLLNIEFNILGFISSTFFYCLFFCFIYSPGWLKFFENKFFVSIGVSSYFLYLIHEYIGVVWIRNIVTFFYPNSFLAPVLVIIVMILFSIFYNQKIESKIIKYLNTILLKRND